MDDLELAGGRVIPAAELTERFDPSGGPGGQHANRSATRVALSWDLGASAVFEGSERDRLLARLATRLHEGVVTVEAGESRSQWRNRQLARRRLRELVEEALRPETKRRPTRPSRAARRRRLEEKRRRSITKRLRGRPDIE